MAALLLLEGTGRQGEAFWRSRGTWLWHVLFAFWPVLFLVAIAAVFRDIKSGNRSVWPSTHGERGAVVFYMAIASILGALPPIFFRHTLSVLPTNLDVITQMSGASTKNFIMSILGTTVVLLLCSGFISVHVQLIGWLSECQTQGEEPGSQSLDEDVLRYLRLRSQLRRFLGFIAAIIGTAILHLGAFRNLLNQVLTDQQELVPASFLMAYGIYFSGMLACIYLPAHKTLTEVGELLANRLVRNSIGARATWKEWSDEQQAVRVYLGLQGSALQELQQGIGVLVPIIASISALSLGAGG
jgi:hypothetical protein